MTTTSPITAIASANGLEATRRAFEMILEGADTLDAAVAGATLVEDDPEDLTVGYGGLPNENGVVELDAAVMHGPSGRAGAVASLRNVRHAAGVARRVMERSDHALLVGEGARLFARAHGFPEEDLLTEKARRIWLHWKETLSGRDDWLPPPPEDLDPDVARYFERRRGARRDAGRPSDATEAFERPTGTVHLAAMDAAGAISVATSTSGLAFKMPGRVGDSAIPGAGLYVDGEVGSCGSTGRGEANLECLGCFAAVELMRTGVSPKDAGLRTLQRIAARTEPRLRDSGGRPDFNLKFYLLSRDGRHAGVSMWGPAKFALTDEAGTRLEDAAFLYERDQRDQTGSGQ